MPVTATLLGSASGSGVDLAIPVTVNQPAGSLVLVAAFANTGPEAFFEGQGFRSLPDDTEGGTWSLTSPHPWVGDITDGAGGVGARIEGTALAAVRTAGADLAAGGGGSGPAPRAGCKDCGQELMGLLMRPSTGGGDTVNVHWFTTNTQDPSRTLGLVVAVEGVQDHIEATDQSQFGNGDSYPATGVNPAAINWTADLGPAFVPSPVANCAVVTVAGAYGTSGWTPVNGSTIGSVSDGTVSLAFSLNPFAASGVPVEPGGAFAGASQYAVANYQTIRLV